MTTDRTRSLTEHAREAGRDGLPPVHLWHPDHCGEIDIRIARNGDWYHEGTVFKRPALVKLFSTILRKDGEEYFLVTPVEKLRIEVEDAPFIIIGLESVKEQGVGWLVLETSTGDRVRIDRNHPLRIETDERTGEPSPYIRVRDRLDGLIARSVFYQLAEMAEERLIDGRRCLIVSSGGEDYVLGSESD